jgi:molybdate transport system substrate-binding protein
MGAGREGLGRQSRPVKLRFVSAGAAQGLVRSVGAREGIEIEGRFGAVGAMREALLAGEPCDIVILTQAQVSELVKSGAVALAGIADLGAVATSIAVRDADPVPRVEDAACLRDALVAADAIHFPDPQRSTAGVHFVNVMRTLGVHDALQSRFRTHPHGAAAMAALARADGRPIGCTQATEILATPGVRLVGPLPHGLELSTIYTAAVHADTANASDAGRFIETMTSPALAESRRFAGFES